MYIFVHMFLLWALTLVFVWQIFELEMVRCVWLSFLPNIRFHLLVILNKYNFSLKNVFNKSDNTITKEIIVE